MKNYCAKSLSLFFICLLSCSTPSKEESIRVRFSQDPESLHPLSYGNAPALQVLNFIYQSLLTINLEDKSITPLLAESLPVVRREDSLSYFTFKIRPEAKWDNGAAVTAADVALSLKLLHSPLLDNERWRAQFDFIKDIVFLPGDSISFTLVCRGYTPEMRLMAGDFFVVPAHTFDPKGTLAKVPFKTIREKFDSLAATSTFQTYAAFLNQSSFARDTALVRGSGPYKLKSWRNGQTLVLEKKPNWWGNQVAKNARILQANPRNISFQVIPDNAAAIMALKAGQLDLLDDMPLVAFQEMKKDEKYKKTFKFYSPPSFDLVFLGMNGAKPALEDKLTRQAIAHLLNVPEIVKTVQGNYATPTVGLVHPEETQYYNKELAPIKFDPKTATHLLGKAGWKKSAEGWHKTISNQKHKLQLEVLHRAGNSDFEHMAILFKQNAQTIGVPVTIQGLESSQIRERLDNKQFDLFFRTLSGNPFSYNLIPLLHSKNAVLGGSNVTSFGTSETDQLLEQIATEERVQQKAMMLKKLQQEMQEESNWVFLYFLQNKIALSGRIDSAVISPLKPGYDLTKFTLKK
jgi:peptide/nickel transport system substrate-binding protein